MYLIASALLFCLGIASTQAWLMNLWSGSIGWLWLGINCVGMIAAYLSAAGTTILLIKIFPLDVLQNNLHSGIALYPAIVVFAMVMSVLRWIILRQRVNAPIARAVLPIAVGMLVWALLGSEAGLYYPTSEQLGLFLLLSLMAGVLVGGVTDKLTTLVYLN